MKMTRADVVSRTLHVSLCVAACLVGVGLLAADTLVLRNGREIRGELIRVDGDRVEFAEDRGRRRSYDRDEVDRIELGRGRDDDDYVHEVGPAGEREVSVRADRPWTDTGIRVRRGQTVSFEASGEVRWGGDRKDGPEGERNSPFNADRPIPGRAGAALIGRVGDREDDPFFIGDNRGGIRMPASGRLYLGVNDDILRDNSGAFRVRIRY
jgi:hypothetical protein